VTFDDFLLLHTHIDAVHDTILDGNRLGILDWEIVSLTPFLTRPSWWAHSSNGPDTFYAPPEAVDPIADWLRKHIQKGDWKLIRPPYWAAFRHETDAMMFILAWSNNSKDNK